MRATLYSTGLCFACHTLAERCPWLRACGHDGPQAALHSTHQAATAHKPSCIPPLRQHAGASCQVASAAARVCARVGLTARLVGPGSGSAGAARSSRMVAGRGMSALATPCNEECPNLASSHECASVEKHATRANAANEDGEDGHCDEGDWE